MISLLLIRHGEPVSAWGLADDPGLSERGLAQANAAAALLSRRAPLAVLSSPQARCRETAAPTETRFGVRLRVDPRVGEVVAPAGVDRRAWLAATFPWRAGAESTRWRALDGELAAWRGDALEAVLACNADTAIFTHFIAINAIVSAAQGRAETIVCRPDFASITELVLEDGRLRLVALGAQMNDGEVR